MIDLVDENDHPIASDEEVAAFAAGLHAFTARDTSPTSSGRLIAFGLGREPFALDAIAEHARSGKTAIRRYSKSSFFFAGLPDVDYSKTPGKPIHIGRITAYLYEVFDHESGAVCATGWISGSFPADTTETCEQCGKSAFCTAVGAEGWSVPACETCAKRTDGE